MAQDNIRNIAIIAHVDHGKTTLVDHLLKQAGTFRENQNIADRVMDSMDLERERGITILSKPTAVNYNGVKINIVDTPGHADFGAEVERIMKMVDGVLLLVDAAEGPLPQTRFVLSKALKQGLHPLVCINKIDRPDQRADAVYSEVFDLFIELDATDEQAEFPVFYACAKEGYAHTEFSLEKGDLRPIFDGIIEHVPAPDFDADATPQFLITQLGYDKYLGRLTIGRLFNGTLKKGQPAMVLGDGFNKQVRLSQLFTYQGLQRVEAEELTTGDIGCLAGIDAISIGDTVSDIHNPTALPRLVVDEPTIGITFQTNNSPTSGNDGKLVTGRLLRERLHKEALHNVSIRLEETPTSDAIRVFGRGELQLAILIEQMRREGFEMCISKPEVKIREEDGRKLEPYELATLDFPEENMGSISDKMNARGGSLVDMKLNDSGRYNVIYRIPARGLIGFRGEYLNATRGLGIVNSLFDGWDDYAGVIAFRQNGSLVSDRAGKTTAYSLFPLQQRGKMFVGNATEVYEGMIVGIANQSNDMNVNVVRPKQLTNIRSAGADTKLILAPPIKLSLESAMDFIAEDELVEITPNFIRLRKRILQANQRTIIRGPKKKKK